MKRSEVKNLKKLQEMNHRTGRGVSKQCLAGIKKYLDEQSYRADLALVTASKSVTGTFSAEVKFQAALGHPTETDLMALVAQSYPQHEIDWQTVEVDPQSGVIVLNLEPSVEMIPVTSVSSIPSEFVSIGAGIYKRAADSSGKVQEIWTLRKGDTGLALYRNHDDLEVTADDATGFKAGDVVNTPYGPGKILRFDELDNAYVQVGASKKLCAADELQKYDIAKEKKLLEDYYENAYGSREYAQSLAKPYGNMYDTVKSKK